MMDRRGESTKRPGAVLSRLVLVLALALTGVLKIDTGRGDWTASPAAASDITSIPAILTAQNQLVLGLFPQDDTPDFTMPAMANPRPTDSLTDAVFLEQKATPSPFAIGILPPVRGPPVV